MFYENHADKAWHADDTDDADDRGMLIFRPIPHFRLDDYRSPLVILSEAKDLGNR